MRKEEGVLRNSQLARDIKLAHDVTGEFFIGASHGSLMVLNAYTFHTIKSLNDYVYHLIETHGGLYETADLFAHISAVSAGSAAAVVGLPALVDGAFYAGDQLLMGSIYVGDKVLIGSAKTIWYTYTTTKNVSIAAASYAKIFPKTATIGTIIVSGTATYFLPASDIPTTPGPALAALIKYLTGGDPTM